MEKYFDIALKEAIKAKRKNEIPVGAVIVKNGKIIAKAHNIRQKKYSVLGHAEILCVLKAEQKQKDWRLDECEMYVTLEPCEMCQKILNESRLNKVFYIKNQNKIKIGKKNTIFKQTNVCDDLMNKYDNLFDDFFVKLRNKVIK